VPQRRLAGVVADLFEKQHRVIGRQRHVGEVALARDCRLHPGDLVLGALAAALLQQIEQRLADGGRAQRLARQLVA
jgi:hypothetical protein